MKTYRALIGQLVFTTAVHVGSGEVGEATDAPVRRDAQGREVIPGTAIAGALRSTATRLAPRISSGTCVSLKKEPGEENESASEPCDCPVCRLFGDVRPGVGDDQWRTHASRVWVYDAYPVQPEKKEADAEEPVVDADSSVNIRDGVGIDRASGAAASAGAVKFDLEVLPAGTRFEFRLELPQTTGEDEPILAAALAEWQAGRGRLGGRTARGLGAFELKDLRYVELDLSQSGDLMTFLKEDQPWRKAMKKPDWLKDNLKAGHESIQDSPDADNPAIARAWVEAEFDLEFDGPFLMHDATLAGLIGYNHAPVLGSLPPANRKDWQPRPVLTGSGLRGVLRSHAERIARTLASHKFGKEEFLARCPACDPVQSNAEAALASCDALLKSLLPGDKSADEDNLCLACRLFGSARRGSRFFVDDARLKGEPQWKTQDFLAIDRFTGGGLDGAKFDALALWKPAFAARIRLENPAPWELGWLTLVLRDLREGLLTAGFGAAKGYGRARASDFKIIVGFIKPNDLPVKAEKRDTLAERAPQADQSIFRVWTFGESDYAARKPEIEDWIEAFVKEVEENFERKETKLPAAKEDTYFGRVDDLYPLEVSHG